MSESERHSGAALKQAFDQVTHWFGNLLAPLVIVTYAKDAQQAYDYIVEHPMLTGSFAILFMAVLAYNILRNVRLKTGGWNWRKPSAPAREPQPSSEPGPLTAGSATDSKRRRRVRALLRWTTIIGSLVAMILLAYMYVLVFVTGIHFAVVCSPPNEAKAIQEVQRLNRILAAKGSALEAHAHASTATGNPNYMIAIGSWHSTREAAQQTLRSAEKILGPENTRGAWIYSTENVSPRRALIGRVRQFFDGMMAYIRS